MKLKDVKEIKEENSILNRYLMLFWAVMVVCFLASYTLERMMNEISSAYYMGFLVLLLSPYLACLMMYRHSRHNFLLRYMICLGYMLLYGFTLFTGVSTRVYVYILPMLSFMVLYHDSRLVLRVGLVAIALNVIVVGRDYFQGLIDESNVYAYEIQIMLMVFCFGATFSGSCIYNNICEKGEQRLQLLLRTQREKTILEERNRYLLTDALTGFGTRRAYEEALRGFGPELPGQMSLAVLDLNDLKGVNDRYGHTVGDDLISRAADYIRKVFDEEDFDYFRIGGDEFVVMGSCSGAYMDRQLKALIQAIASGENMSEIKVSLAVGSASTDEGDEMITGSEALFKAADRRMYDNKREYYQDKRHDRRRR